MKIRGRGSNIIYNIEAVGKNIKGGREEYNEYLSRLKKIRMGKNIKL